MTQEITVKAEATDQGRVLVRTTSDPLFYASPGAARDLARDLVNAAKIAERVAATAFVQSGQSSSDNPSAHPSDPPPATTPRVTGAQRLRDMLENGYLFEGEQILGWYPSDSTEPPVVLTLRGDGVLVDERGTTFENPSKAASALLPRIPKSTNGWFPWKVCRSNSPVSLNAIMNAMKNDRPARPRTEWQNLETAPTQQNPASG